jgi:hypothetical protein
MQDVIGHRGLCKRCFHSNCQGNDVICHNKNSQLYKEKVNSVLCAPCFQNSKAKESVEVQAVGFSS